MKHNTVFPSNVLSVLSTAALAATLSAGCTKKLDKEDQKSASSYAVGYALGQQIAKVRAEINTDVASLGFMDGINEKPQMENAQIQESLSRLEQKRRELEKVEGSKRLEASKKAFEELKAKPGMKVLEPNIVVEEVKPATGAKAAITEASDVRLRYTAQTMAGNTFDQSPGGEPVKVPFKNLLPGVKKAVQQMGVGAQWKIHLSPEYGFGPTDRPGVPAFSALTYTVELVGVEAAKPAATKKQ